MNIAVVHGYWLRGTGSNIYVRNLVRELCRAGHQVSLFCQEDQPEEADFVNRRVDFAGPEAEQQVLWERTTDYPGFCSLYRPDLQGVLPVYVYDDYPGYRVQTLAGMDRQEIDRYLEQNRRALVAAWVQNPPALVLSQHTVMQPVYAGRALDSVAFCRQVTVVHGSCLHFAVKESCLVEEYAREAINRSNALVFVSSHSQREFLEHFADVPELADKTRVVPAGVDVECFQPLQNGKPCKERLETLEGLVQKGPWPVTGRSAQDRRELAAALQQRPRDLASTLEQARKRMPNLAPDQDTGERLLELPLPEGPALLFFGKYLWTKGLQLLVTAAPLLWARWPDASIVLVGYGSLRPYLEALVAALDSGDRELFGRLLREANVLVPAGGEEMVPYWKPLLEALESESWSQEYFQAARGRAAERLILTGYLDHRCLRQLLPCMDVAVLPSLFPEAFGLVAVESLAAGVMPLVTDHSGLGEVWRRCWQDLAPDLEGAGLSRGTRGLALHANLVFELAEQAAGFLQTWRSLPREQQLELRQRAHQVALENYAWSRVARELVTLSVLDLSPGGS